MKHLDCIAYLIAMRPNWDIPKETARLWALELSVFPVEAVYAACKAAALESEYQPTIAAIFKRAKALTATEGTGRLTPGEAWAELMRNRAVLSKNRYESRDEKRIPYTWTSEAARSAAESVDWKGDWEGESMGTIRAQFERYFNAIVERQAQTDWKQETLQHVEDVKRIEAQQPRRLQ